MQTFTFFLDHISGLLYLIWLSFSEGFYFSLSGLKNFWLAFTCFGLIHSLPLDPIWNYLLLPKMNGISVLFFNTFRWHSCVTSKHEEDPYYPHFSESNTIETEHSTVDVQNKNIIGPKSYSNKTIRFVRKKYTSTVSLQKLVYS